MRHVCSEVPIKAAYERHLRADGYVYNIGRVARDALLSRLGPRRAARASAIVAGFDAINRVADRHRRQLRRHRLRPASAGRRRALLRAPLDLASLQVTEGP